MRAHHAPSSRRIAEEIEKLPSQLSLNPDVRYCAFETHTVFMDLRRNRYFAVTGNQSDFISRSGRGFSFKSLGDREQALAKRLVDEGVLNSGAHAPMCRRDPQSESPDSSAFSCKTFRPNSFPLLEAILMMRCLISVHMLWFSRKRKTKALLRSVRSWRARTGKPTQLPSAEVEHIANVFKYLTPLFLTTNDNCLFRSILLMRYLTLKGIGATLHMGVRISPFCAHSWVQYGSMVLNDDLDSVLEFKQILAA